MSPRPGIALIGAGNLAGALGPALLQAGLRVEEVIARERPASQRRARLLARRLEASAATLETARWHAGVIWICVPDDAIAACARRMAGLRRWTGKIILHASGALASDVLAPLRRKGAAVGSLHPLMTFVRASAPSLRGVSFAVEGDPAAVALGRRLARALEGEAFSIAKRDKALYHAWGAFASPLLVAALAQAEEIAQRSGISRRRARRAMAPIVRRTVENFLNVGGAAAFSGPLIRGDVRTIARHWSALARVPGARDVYAALVRSALRTLPVKNRAAIRRLLAKTNRQMSL